MKQKNTPYTEKEIKERKHLVMQTLETQNMISNQCKKQHKNFQKLSKNRTHLRTLEKLINNKHFVIARDGLNCDTTILL